MLLVRVIKSRGLSGYIWYIVMTLKTKQKLKVGAKDARESVGVDMTARLPRRAKMHHWSLCITGLPHQLPDMI